MSQYDFGVIDPATTSGTQLAELVGNFRDALNSGHSGVGRPAYAKAGTTWIEVAGNIWKLNIFDGTNDITLFEINTSTNSLSSPIFNADLYLRKTGGTVTGSLNLIGRVVAGTGSGAVALTTNDGQGNCNITFNHEGGVPDSDNPAQSAVRISFATDQNAASCIFSLADSTTQGLPVATEEVLRLSLGEAHFTKNMKTLGHLAADRAVGDWIATKPEAEAGTSNDQIMTPLRTVNSIAANQAVQAWVNFNGTGTPTIRDAHNVTSITDNGTGDYTVNFTTAMPDANYAVFGAGRFDESAANAAVPGVGVRRAVGAQTTGSVRIHTTDAGAGVANDCQMVSVSILA
ncbi:hypothetical protein BZA02_109122 [Ruegeria sp. P4]|nr:hypothetical protein BZA02_109122 [Ruegeria sp. P4]